MSHGTHTTGTAAGSYMGNDWYGMAPEADLVICAMPGNQLTDVNIANGLRYIFDFAERRHQPCVVNMSIGDNVGAHDGSSELCHVMESLVGPGRIIVVSAGNDGDKPTHVSHRPKSCTDSLRVLLQENATSLRRYGFMSVWNTDAGRRHHGVEHVVVDRNTGAILYRSDCVALLPADSVYAISSDTHPEWSKYFTGEVLMATERGENGWYHFYCEFDASATDSRYLFGFLYNGDAESQMEGWCYANLQIDPAGLNGFAQGDGEMSISDLATTDAVISVGGYCSRTRFKRKDGKWENYKKCPLGEIAPFSSYGPDMNGNSRPDVTAPGVMVLSSASRFDSYLMNTLNMRPPAVTWNGQTLCHEPGHVDVNPRGDWHRGAVAGGKSRPDTCRCARRFAPHLLSRRVGERRRPSPMGIRQAGCGRRLALRPGHSTARCAPWGASGRSVVLRPHGPHEPVSFQWREHRDESPCRWQCEYL